MRTETKQELIERRYREIREGGAEAIRREVEWLKRHNFPVWVCDEEGNVVDASQRNGTGDPESDA